MNDAQHLTFPVKPVVGQETKVGHRVKEAFDGRVG